MAVEVFSLSAASRLIASHLRHKPTPNFPLNCLHVSKTCLQPHVTCSTHFLFLFPHFSWAPAVREQNMFVAAWTESGAVEAAKDTVFYVRRVYCACLSTAAYRIEFHFHPHTRPKSSSSSVILSLSHTHTHSALEVME